MKLELKNISITPGHNEIHADILVAGDGPLLNCSFSVRFEPSTDNLVDIQHEALVIAAKHLKFLAGPERR